MTRLSALLAAKDGTAITELALVAPILAVMAAGVIDLSTAYSRKLGLEQGAQRAIEKIMQTTDDNTVEGTLVAEAVCQVNGMREDGTCNTTPITSANVTVTYKRTCRTAAGALGATQTDTNPDALDALSCPAGFPVQNRFIDVTIVDNFQGTFIHKFWGNQNSFQITASAGMRTL
jgi:Flp pilus assembly protein TadG